MKNITATLYLPRYLEQYLRHHYGSPVRFPARSMENELLRRLTTRPPAQPAATAAADECAARLTALDVVLPDDDLHRPEYFCYLGRSARRRFCLADILEVCAAAGTLGLVITVWVQFLI